MSVADQLGFGPTREAIADRGGWMIKVTPGAMFGSAPTQTVRLTEDQYQRYLDWRAGRCMIQDALPEMSRSEREILQSGLGPDNEIWDGE